MLKLSLQPVVPTGIVKDELVITPFPLDLGIEICDAHWVFAGLDWCSHRPYPARCFFGNRIIGNEVE